MSSLSTLISGGGGGGGIASIQIVKHQVNTNSPRTISISSVDTSKSYITTVTPTSSSHALYDFHFDSSTQVGYRMSSQYAHGYFTVIEFE